MIVRDVLGLEDLETLCGSRATNAPKTKNCCEVTKFVEKILRQLKAGDHICRDMALSPRLTANVGGGQHHDVVYSIPNVNWGCDDNSGSDSDSDSDSDNDDDGEQYTYHVSKD